MITTINELFENIFYDWGFCQNPQIKQNTNNPRSFTINKTFIFLREDKYLLQYKTEEVELTEEVYKQFSNFYDIYSSDPEFENKMIEFHNDWLDSKLETNQEFSELINKIKVQGK